MAIPNKPRLIQAGLVMLLIYTVYFLVVREPFVRYEWNISRRVGHLVTLTGIFLVYFTGIWAFKPLKYQLVWLPHFWHVAHVLLIAVLLLIGLADVFTGGLPAQWRLLGQTLAEALVSPVLYVIANLLYRLAAEAPAKKREPH